MKKIFISVTTVIIIGIISFLITLNKQKINIYIDTRSPFQINIFDHSTVSAQTLLQERKEDEAKYNELLGCLKEITETSKMERLVSRVGLENKIHLDSEKKYTTWSTDIQNKNIVIELIYNREQDLVVYDNGDTRVVSYYCMAFVIPETPDFSEIIVYYANTSDDNAGEKTKSYATNKPLTLYGTSDEILDYIKAIKESAKSSS